MAVGPIYLRASDFGGVNPTHSSERWLHALILLAAVAVPLLGAALTVLNGDQVAVAGFEH